MHVLICTLFSLFMVFGGELYDSDLKVVEYNSLDSCVIIVCGSLHCKDCIIALDSSRYLWSDKFKTVLVTKSNNNPAVNASLTKFFQTRIKFDLILFQYDEDYDMFTEFDLSKYHIANTPAIIIKCGEKDTLIDGKALYSYGNRPGRVRKKIVELLNNF
jgi:hypothetical protein